MLTNSNKCHVTLAKLLCLLIGWFSFPSMAHIKFTPMKGDKKKTKKVKTRAQVHAAPVEPPAPAEPPVSDVKVPPILPILKGMERRRAEAEKLGEVGSHWRHHQPNSWPRWLQSLGHLCQVGRSQPRRKLWLTMGGKAPQKEFLWDGKVKKPPMYWLGMVALCKIHQFQRSTDLLIHKLPFSHLVCKIALEVGWYDMHLQVCAFWLCRKLQRHILLGSWKIPTYMPFTQNALPLCPRDIQLAQCFHGEHLHYWISFSPKSVSVFLLVVGCVGFCQYQGRET